MLKFNIYYMQLYFRHKICNFIFRFSTKKVKGFLFGTLNKFVIILTLTGKYLEVFQNFIGQNI